MATSLRLFTLISILLLGSSSILQAQNKTCGTDIERKKLIEKYPEILEREAAFDKMAAEKLTSIARIEGEKIIIPVVFHIIHDYGAENISDAQVLDAIANMNRDYSKTNFDFGATIPEFQAIAADCEIEFRLAGTELSGTCTSGIDRIASLRTYEGTDAAKFGGWQSGKYLNIWVVKDLDNGAAAYAYYPTSITGIMYTVDGVICRYDYVGTIGTAGAYAAHVLSHEVGHYLNLQHVWGNSNDPGVACGDDQVTDTPVTEGWTSCNIYGNTCTDPIDNVQNHMEYSYCTTMFTLGQKARMIAALENTDAMRNNLWTAENLLLTGTNDGFIHQPCAPIADFYASYRLNCADDAVNFYDVSYNGIVESRSWQFEGGAPAVSDLQNPVVIFNEPGWHKVVLTVNNAVGSDTKSWDKYIYISPVNAIYDASYFGDFNDQNEVENNWVLYNKYPDEREWKWRSSNGYWNTGCIWLNSRFGPNLETDVVISPSFDLSSGETDNVFFKYSTTSYGNTDDDYDMSLKLYYSTNCGQTWIYINKLTGDNLITSYGGGSDFYPVNPDQWKVTDFNIPDGSKTTNTKFKFEFVYNPYVNNIFIDDFNFKSGTLSTSEQESLITLKIAPNPVDDNGTTSIYYSLKQNSDVQLTITDLMGKTIELVSINDQQAGSHQYIFKPSSFSIAKGCYFINISDGNYVTGSKLIIF